MKLRKNLLFLLMILSALVILSAILAVVLFETQLSSVKKKSDRAFITTFSAAVRHKITPMLNGVAAEIKNKTADEQQRILAEKFTFIGSDPPDRTTEIVFELHENSVLHTNAEQKQKPFTQLLQTAFVRASTGGGEDIVSPDSETWFIYTAQIQGSPYWYSAAVNMEPILKAANAVFGPFLHFHRLIFAGILGIFFLLLFMINVISLPAFSKLIRLEDQNRESAQELSLSNLLLCEEIAVRKKIESELKQANRELLRVSITDPLTKIANRRLFDQTLEKEWKRHLRKHLELSLLICDVDHFKLYNDNYGHQRGDDVLEAIASALTRSCRRPSDLAARYGGEEFVVLLPETDRAGVLLVADSISAILKDASVPHRGSPVSPYITVSIGAASVIPTKETSPELLLRNADSALYKAKELGRNRVEYA